jgi:pentatricopeptide repeat protein
LDVIDAEARCALIVAMARSEKLDRALDIWRDSPKAQSFSKARKHTSSEGNDYIGDVRAMYECLIEVCCHEDRIDDALEVFDHLKDAGVRVSTVTLAFLESSCRRCRVEEWRMFDVCAQMRAQVEQKNEGRLAKPTKMSHHVRDDGNIASELATDGLGGEQKTSAWRKNVD